MNKINETINFNYTGDVQTWVVPNNVTRIKLDIYGAKGGSYSSTSEGGNGGRAWGELSVTEGQVFNIYVGRMGIKSMTGEWSKGGFNGGGDGGKGSGANGGGSGGDSTDVRLGGTELSHRIIVAGGGGGSSYGDVGGYGGGFIGGSTPRSGVNGRGGTQTSGGIGSSPFNNDGSIWKGGSGMQNTSYYSGGGGGGGYYGGGGGNGANTVASSAGGGGSSYVGTLENAGTESGVHNGDGFAIITVLKVRESFISEPPRYIGDMSDRNNILSYNITTHLLMDKITEKINGVVIAEKYAAEGEELTVSLSEDVWSNLPYGEKHILTIEMGDYIWSYTFNKNLDVSSNFIEINKALGYTANEYLPNLKQLLVNKFNEDVSNYGFKELIESVDIESLGGKRWASGTTMTNGSAVLSITGLSFKPRIISLNMPSVSSTYGHGDINFDKNNILLSNGSTLSRRTTTFNNDGITVLNMMYNAREVVWVAIE